MNIAKNFRLEFEKMRTVQTENEVDEFKRGITRMLSNLMVYEVKRQYMEDPSRFRNTSIHEPDDEDGDDQDDFSEGTDQSDEDD